MRCSWCCSSQVEDQRHSCKTLRSVHSLPIKLVRDKWRRSTRYAATESSTQLQGIPGVKPLIPEGGLFVMVDVRGLGMPSEAIRRFLLREAGVIVLHGSAYGPGGEGFLRVSFASGGQALEQGLVQLQNGLLRLAGGSKPRD